MQVLASRDFRRGRWYPRPLMPGLSPLCLVIDLWGPHHRRHHRLPKEQLASLIVTVPPAPAFPAPIADCHLAAFFGSLKQLRYELSKSKAWLCWPCLSP